MIARVLYVLHLLKHKMQKPWYQHWKIGLISCDSDWYLKLMVEKKSHFIAFLFSHYRYLLCNKQINKKCFSRKKCVWLLFGWGKSKSLLSSPHRAWSICQKMHWSAIAYVSMMYWDVFNSKEIQYTTTSEAAGLSAYTYNTYISFFN